MTDLVTSASIITAIISITSSIVMLLWVWNFYRLRNLKEIASRRPNSSLLCGVCCTLGNMVVFPTALLYLNNPYAHYIPWVGSLIHLGYMVSVLAPYHIFTFRAYMVYFEIKFHQTLEDQKWRLYIDPEETNWFLKRRHSWGNQKRVGIIIFIHWIIFTLLVVSVTITNDHKGNELSRVLMGVAGLDTMFIDTYLYLRFPKLQDIWSIHDEIKLTLRIELIQQILYYVLIGALKLEYYTMVYVATFLILSVTSFIFVLVTHWRVFRIFKLPSIPCIEAPCVKDTKNNDEAKLEKDIKGIYLHNVLQDEQGFNEFARHLTREFCVENLLFFVEIEQWKNALISKQQYSNFVNAEVETIEFPENAPKSKIVGYQTNDDVGLEIEMATGWGPTKKKKKKRKHKKDKNKQLPSDEEYLQAIRLFRKYIPNSAYFALNVSSATRAKLYIEFVYQEYSQSNEDEMIIALQSRTMDRKTLFHLFDKTIAEIWYLLTLAYIRFKGSDAFKKLAQDISTPVHVK